MTLGEYRATLKGKRVPHYYYNREGQIRVWHRDAVATALQLGWDIPIRVLGEFEIAYPDIRRMYHNYDGIK